MALVGSPTRRAIVVAAAYRGCWCLLPSAHSACARKRHCARIASAAARSAAVAEHWQVRRAPAAKHDAATAAATNSALLALLTLCVEVNGAWCLLACFNASDYCWHWCSNQTIVLVIFDYNFKILLMSQKEAPKRHPWVLPRKVAEMV